MNVVKNVFEIRKGYNQLLTDVSKATGLTKVQILHDAFAVYYGRASDEIAARRDYVIRTMKNLESRNHYPDLEPAGAALNDAPAPAVEKANPKPRPAPRKRAR